MLERANAQELDARDGDSATARRRPAPCHAASQLPAGAAIRALKVLSKAKAPVSEILVSTSLVAVRKICEGKERAIVRAAIELNSHARSGLSADARVAMRRAAARSRCRLPTSSWRRPRRGARAVALGAHSGDKDRLAEDSELVHRDAHRGKYNLASSRGSLGLCRAKCRRSRPTRRRHAIGRSVCRHDLGCCRTSIDSQSAGGKRPRKDPQVALCAPRRRAP